MQYMMHRWSQPYPLKKEKLQHIMIRLQLIFILLSALFCTFEFSIVNMYNFYQNILITEKNESIFIIYLWKQYVSSEFQR